MSSYPREGQDWAHFEIRGEIARGNMGVVYRAVDRRTQQEVALKILVGGHDNPEAVERFKREAKSLARLSHPHIVNVHSFGVQNGLPFLTMDYVPGTTLQELLDRGALPLPRAVDLLGGVARGLDHVHSRGVLHRDVKPANILIGADGKPRLTDFGLAKLADASISLTHDGDIIGTPVYMSPEQIQGQQRLVGPPSDVWALGVVLYVMLTNELPFRGRTVDTVSEAVVQMDPVPPRELFPGVHEDLERICLAALQKDPRLRYRSAGELARDLEAYLLGGHVLAGEVTPAVRVRRLGRFVRLHASAVLALTLSVLVITGAVALQLLLKSRDTDSAAQVLAGRLEEETARLDEAIESAQAALEEGRASDAAKQLRVAEKALHATDPLGELSEGLAVPLARLTRLRLRVRIELDDSRAPPEEGARELGETFATGGALEDAEDYLAYAWYRQWQDADLLGRGLKQLPPIGELAEREHAERWLSVSWRWRLLAEGELRGWSPLLERQGPLEEAARRLEVSWLLEFGRLEEARAELERVLPTDAPELHARYVLATQRWQSAHAKLPASLAWTEAHSLLNALAAKGSAAARVRAAAAEAELLLTLGEPLRSFQRLERERMKWKNAMAPTLAAQLNEIEFLGSALWKRTSGASKSRRSLTQSSRLPHRVGHRLAQVERALARPNPWPFPANARGALARRVDQARASLAESFADLALIRLGCAELGRMNAPNPEPPTLIKGEAGHPLILAAGAIRALTQQGKAGSLTSEEVEEIAKTYLGTKRSDRAKHSLWLRTPSYFIADEQLSESNDLFWPRPELPQAPPLGLHAGRVLMVRAHSNGERATLEQARRALAVAVRLAPTHPDVRIARARLFLRRAAWEGDEAAREQDLRRALREAGAAVLAASHLPHARSLFLQALWALQPTRLDLKQPLIRRLLYRVDARGEATPKLAEAFPLSEEALIESLASGKRTKSSRVAYLLAGRARHALHKARGAPAEGDLPPLVAAIRERLALVGDESIDERMPLEGELLLAQPERIEAWLLGKVPMAQKLVDQATYDLEQAKVGQRVASCAARAVVVAGLICNLGARKEPGAHEWLLGRRVLASLWRDRPGPSCLSLNAALTLTTRPVDASLLPDLASERAQGGALASERARGGALYDLIVALGQGAPPNNPTGNLAKLLEHERLARWTKVCFTE